MNIETLIKVLEEVSKRSGYAQKICIRFKSKAGWHADVNMHLYPYIYQDAFPEPPESFWKNDFSELYMLYDDPSFEKWEEISFLCSDALLNYIIILGLNEPHSRLSHYSGHMFISWISFLLKDEAGKCNDDYEPQKPSSGGF